MTFHADPAALPAYTLADAIIAALDLCDAALNTPPNGAEPIVPTGDHFNALQDLLRDVVRQWSGPHVASAAALVRLLADHPRLEERLINAAYPDGVDQALRIALADIRAAAPASQG